MSSAAGQLSGESVSHRELVTGARSLHPAAAGQEQQQRQTHLPSATLRPLQPPGPAGHRHGRHPLSARLQVRDRRVAAVSTQQKMEKESSEKEMVT